ncbi:MAG: hypothetical protein WC761_02970 [Candidatus Paceibacterota bacterium]|jgi:phosphomannomutase
MPKDYKAEYVSFLKGFLKIERPLKVVFDSGCGPAGAIVRDVFTGSSIDMTIINETIDPDFKTRAPNPLLPEAADSCANAIKEHNADFGIMFDADADRAIFVNPKGELVPAYLIAVLLSKEMKPPYVVDELVYESLRFLGVIPEDGLVPSRIGAYFIKKLMKEGGYSFGAEYSGHYYYKYFFGLDSGIFTAITVINALSRQTKSFLELQEEIGDHEISTTEISTAGKDMNILYAALEEKYGKEAKRIEKRDGVTFVFDECWTNIRSSNTEPILRVVAGGTKAMKQRIEDIEKFVREN